MDNTRFLEESFAELKNIKTAAELEAEAAEHSIYVDDTVKKEYEKYYRTDNPLSDVHLLKYTNAIEGMDPIKYYGRVRNVRGLIIEGRGPEACIGEVCRIRIKPGHEVLAEVVGFERDVIKLMAIGDMEGIAPGCVITATGRSLVIPVGENLMGRVLDGIARPIDNKGSLDVESWRGIHAEVPDALTRKRITESLAVGVRAIDGLLTVGRGQRVGIFSGSGVGKSTLLSMMARGTSADVTILALVGERGKEVRDFIERDLGEEGLGRSILVIATAEQEPLVRIRAAFVATAIAEYFRDQGKNVLLLMDSLTRFAQAQRQIGLSIGEPPTMRGFTPSVFSLIPKLVERAGTNNKGSITAFYTVLVEGDDVINDPVADASRGHLDGHIVLSRDLAMKNHYPAIDIPGSISRVMIDLVNEKHIQNANNLREMIKVWRDAEDLINIGAYARGSNPKIDQAIAMQGDINKYLRQGIFEASSPDEAALQLAALFPKGVAAKVRTGRARRQGA
jgi:flagellum-specific ATP synthase